MSVHPRRRLTWEAVCAIRAAPASLSTAELARRHNVSPSALRAVRQGLTWKRPPEPAPAPPRKRTLADGRRKLTWDEIEAIRDKARSGRSNHSLAREYGVTAPNVWHFVRGLTWRNPPLTPPPPAATLRPLY